MSDALAHEQVTHVDKRIPEGMWDIFGWSSRNVDGGGAVLRSTTSEYHRS